MGEHGWTDSTVVMDVINRLDTKMDNIVDRLEVKIDSSNKRLEQKLDYNNETLEKKINDWITKIDNEFDSVKSQLNDHEVRIRNIENYRKDQIDKVFNTLTRASESGSFDGNFYNSSAKKEESFIKKIFTHPIMPYFLFLTVILVFISGNFDGISELLKVIAHSK